MISVFGICRRRLCSQGLGSSSYRRLQQTQWSGRTWPGLTGQTLMQTPGVASVRIVWLSWAGRPPRPVRDRPGLAYPYYASALMVSAVARRSS